ncbi:hypothetical protein [Asticcacaulis solisilvae]|uniref:hypothetical protein n=1 Tax=Asticcacaulis solisilvae TaxID=1217274 RepID=UPI003FD88CB2
MRKLVFSVAASLAVTFYVFPTAGHTKPAVPTTGRPAPAVTGASASALSPTYDFDKVCGKGIKPADVAAVCAQLASNKTNYLSVIVSSSALAVSMAAAWLLLVQISQSGRQERQRLHRRHLAVRAAMPLLLSDIIDYTDAQVEGLRLIFADLEQDLEDRRGRVFAAPPLDANIVQRLQDAIEASPRADIQERLADVLSTMQLVNSRLNGLALASWEHDGQLSRENLIENMIDVASLRALTSTLYRYVRRETETLDSYTYDTLMDEVRGIYFFDRSGRDDDIDGPNFPIILERIEGWRRANLDPYIFRLNPQRQRPSILRRWFSSASVWAAEMASRD